VKKATAGAIQHLDFAAKAEGLTPNITNHATPVAAALREASQLTDQAIAAAQRARTASDAAEATKIAGEVDALTAKLAEKLQEAQTHMAQMLKAEGLEGAPR
jgi:hypothetical protein